MKKMIALCCMAAPLLYAEMDAGCIKLGWGKEYGWDKKDKRYLENTCDREMYVFWCHDKDEKGHRDSVCGKKKKYYAQGWVFKPGEKKFNKYTIPDDATVQYGACTVTPFYTWDRAVHTFGTDGSYECAVPGISRKLEENEFALRCESGSTKLLRLESILGPKRNVLKITDTESGIRHTINTRGMKERQVHKILCEESSDDRSFARKALGKLKSFIRKKSKEWCDDNPGECKPPRHHSGSSGVRG